MNKLQLLFLLLTLLNYGLFILICLLVADGSVLVIFAFAAFIITLELYYQYRTLQHERNAF